MAKFIEVTVIEQDIISGPDAVRHERRLINIDLISSVHLSTHIGSFIRMNSEDDFLHCEQTYDEIKALCLS